MTEAACSLAESPWNYGFWAGPCRYQDHATTLRAVAATVRIHAPAPAARGATAFGRAESTISSGAITCDLSTSGFRRSSLPMNGRPGFA